jgi:hypothetical protein
MIGWIVLTCAWRPFLDPIQLDRYWLVLILPLVLAISVVFKAMKLPNPTLPAMTVHSLKLSAQILGGLAVVAAVLLFLTEIVGL